MARRDPVPDPSTADVLTHSVDQLTSEAITDCTEALTPTSLPKPDNRERTLEDRSVADIPHIVTSSGASPRSVPQEILKGRTPHRACKTRHHLPKRSEFIEVLWLLDTVDGSPTTWCLAEVVHITRASTAIDSECIGTALIVYPQTEDWEEQINFVEFLPGNLIRCTAEQTDSEDRSASSVNDNPKLAWRTHCAYDSTSPLFSTDDQDKDDDWDFTAITTRGKRYRSVHTSFQRYEQDMKRLRSGHASLMVEMEGLKRMFHELSSQKVQAPLGMYENARCSSIQCVLTKLRYKLALRMQSALRHNVSVPDSSQHEKASSDTFGGVLRLLLKARADCTLNQFESIARHINASRLSDRKFFYPDFTQTQLPSLCSDEFRIHFSTFSDLCNAIGIASISDRLEMARKCGSCPCGDLLRLVGTYAVTENNCCEAVRFFMGTSCGTEVDRQHNNSIAPKDPLFPVLYRKSGEWNQVDARFLNCLQLQRHSLPSLSEDISELCTFSLVWKRSPEVQTRWSKSFHDELLVFGTIEIRIPCIQVCGRVLCTELAGLSTDEEWVKLLSRSS